MKHLCGNLFHLRTMYYEEELLPYLNQASVPFLYQYIFIHMDVSVLNTKLGSDTTAAI